MRAVTRAGAIVILVIGVLTLLPAGAGAQTYRWVDEKGVAHYVQGIDNVPERSRDPRLLPAERAAALEALGAGPVTAVARPVRDRSPSRRG